MFHHNPRWWKFTLGICVLLAAMAFLCSCSLVKTEQHESWYEPFDTLTNLTIYENKDKGSELIAAVDEKLTRYDQLFDIYNDYPGVNNLKTVNDQAGIAPVSVDAEIIELLKFSIDMYEKTDGAMNIAMGSVLSIWHEYRENGIENPQQAALPQMDELLAAAEHTDISKIVIDETAGTVYLSDSQMSLDVGAVAKGYAAQKISEMIAESGVTSALLDMSSAIAAIGDKPDGQSWRLALQNPDTDSENSVLHAITLEDKVLATSGDYQRYYEVDGQRYHHIIDPDTLMPAEGFSSISVICDDAAVADALSTALFCMTLEEGQALLKGFDGTEALWIGTDGTETMTDGFNDYMER